MTIADAANNEQMIERKAKAPQTSIGNRLIAACIRFCRNNPAESSFATGAFPFVKSTIRFLISRSLAVLLLLLTALSAEAKDSDRRWIETWLE
jgi:hypothetical protein